MTKKDHYNITDWRDGSEIFSGEFESMKECVEHAVSREISLSCADLRGAKLGVSDLRGSDLRDSKLGVADLRGSDLSGSDLRGSDLCYADLRGSDLRGTEGVKCLQVHDPRGYRPIAVEDGNGGFRIYSGCRVFGSIDEAIAHWGSDDYHTPEIGREYVRALKRLQIDKYRQQQAADAIKRLRACAICGKRLSSIEGMIQHVAMVHDLDTRAILSMAAAVVDGDDLPYEIPF